MGKRRCTIKLPREEAIKYAVKVLKTLYPEDNITIINPVGIMAAINAARMEFRYFRGKCIDRKIAALSRLFYELIQLHPLIDGNKRLAALILAAGLTKNNLTVKKSILKDLALKVARGDIGFRGVFECLRRHVRRI